MITVLDTSTSIPDRSTHFLEGLPRQLKVGVSSTTRAQEGDFRVSVLFQSFTRETNLQVKMADLLISGVNFVVKVQIIAKNELFLER